jgi:hypothetical protein
MMQAAAIPYRTEPALAEGQWLVIMLVTVLLLAALYAGLLYARRKGWLDRWMLDSGSRTGKSDRTLWRAKTQRIGRQTRVHTLQQGSRTLVIVESGTSVAVTTWVEHIKDLAEVDDA